MVVEDVPVRAEVPLSRSFLLSPQRIILKTIPKDVGERRSGYQQGFYFFDGKVVRTVDAMYSVSCDPTCGFLVRTHDRDEAVDLALEHATNKHAELNPTREMMEGMLKEE